MKAIFPSARGGRMRRRGFALPVVLLLVAAMSVVALKLVESARTNIEVARADAEEAVARNAADAGYALLIARYASEPDRNKGPEGFEAEVGRAKVTVEVTPESGKIDLNTGSPPLLAGIFRIGGADPKVADALSAEIADYRNSGDGNVLYGADELLRFQGMDLALLERIRPYVTVYQSTPGIDTRSASKAVLMAVPNMTEETADRIVAARDSEEILDREDRLVLRPYRSRGRPVYTIRATAVLPGGTSFTREAVADLGDPLDPLLLAWRRGYSGAVATARGSE